MRAVLVVKVNCDIVIYSLNFQSRGVPRPAETPREPLGFPRKVRHITPRHHFLLRFLLPRRRRCSRPIRRPLYLHRIDATLSNYSAPAAPKAFSRTRPSHFGLDPSRGFIENNDSTDTARWRYTQYRCMSIYPHPRECPLGCRTVIHNNPSAKTQRGGAEGGATSI